jgi:hypothetical protein
MQEMPGKRCKDYAFYQTLLKIYKLSELYVPMYAEIDQELCIIFIHILKWWKEKKSATKPAFKREEIHTLAQTRSSLTMPNSLCSHSQQLIKSACYQD